MLYGIIDFFITLSLRHASGIIVLSDTMKKRVLHKVPEKKDGIYSIVLKRLWRHYLTTKQWNDMLSNLT